MDVAAGERFVEKIRRLVDSTRRPEVEGDLGGFGGLFALDPARLRQPLLVSSTDGVGTKLKIAQVLDIHDTVGIDLVAMCVNDVVVCGAEPLFFLDYLACGSLDGDRLAQVVAGIAAGCRQAGCALIGGETAEMPGFYPPGSYDLAGFCVGLAERDSLLGPERVREGDVFVGLASSGLHSNGFSLVRRVLVDGNEEALGRHLEALGCSLGEELLRPTRIYVRVALEMIAAGGVHALCHITGGGLVGNLPRVFPGDLQGVVSPGAWPRPPIFELVARRAGLDEAPMFETFNMGIGLVAVAAPGREERLIEIAGRHQVPAWVIGRVGRREPGAPPLLLST